MSNVTGEPEGQQAESLGERAERAELDSRGHFWVPLSGNAEHTPIAHLPPEGQVVREETIRARAETERAKIVLEVNQEATKQEELKLRQEEKKIEREKIRQRTSEQPTPADPNDIQMEFAMSGDTVDMRLDFLAEPFLPRASIVGFFGRGETAKSSLLATLASYISPWASTLWVSCEEPEQWVRARHTNGIPIADDKGSPLPPAAVGVDKSMLVVTAVASKRDAQGRVIASNFNIWEHLQSAITKAKWAFANESRPELRLVVLDTAVGLTTWGKGEGPNDDASVKKLLGYLKHLAEANDVTIAFIGHSNKGKHDHFADGVLGATAWVNSPRLSFMHAKHLQMDGHCVIRVAKSNVIPHMAAAFSIHMVKELHTFAGGPKAGLLKVFLKPLVWGATEAEALWEEATTKPKEDGEGGVEFGGNLKRMPTVVENAIQAIVAMVVTTPLDQYITREDVHARLGRDVGRREWQKVDDHIAGHPTVMMERGPMNRVLYRMRPRPTV